MPGRVCILTSSAGAKYNNQMCTSTLTSFLRGILKSSPDPLQCSLLQHGSFQATSTFRREEVELMRPSGSAAYKETTLQRMRTSQISATVVNCDPHSRILVALLVHSIKDSANRL